MRLKDQVAIVTGSTMGIGRGIAARFAAEGASVVITGRTTRLGKSLEHKLKQKGHNVMFIRCDVTKQQEVTKLVDKTVKEFGKIDILVNNAGAKGLEGPFYDLSTEEWKRKIDVNLTGVFFCSRAVGKFMIQQRSGRIINIGSVYSFASAEGAAAYSAAKGGLIQLTRSMAIDLAPYNILVNTIAPGAIQTESTKEIFEREEYQEHIGHILLKRPGQIDEVAAVAVFLASREASYITGETIIVDGGFLTHFPPG